MMNIPSSVKATLLFLLVPVFFSCTTPPEKPVTLRQFSALGINKYFDFDYPNEYLLKHLNEKGMVVFEAKSKVEQGKPFYIKIMATPEGPVAETYAIE